MKLGLEQLMRHLSLPGKACCDWHLVLRTIREIAETGVDFVSVGRITQSAPAADIGLDYSPA